MGRRINWYIHSHNISNLPTWLHIPKYRNLNYGKFGYVSEDKKNQLDVTFCFLYLSSNSCSTCFGQPCAHHQELTTA